MSIVGSKVKVTRTENNKNYNYGDLNIKSSIQRQYVGEITDVTSEGKVIIEVGNKFILVDVEDITLVVNDDTSKVLTEVVESSFFGQRRKYCGFCGSLLEKYKNSRCPRCLAYFN